MADSPIDAPGTDPIGPLVAQWSEAESSRSEQLEQLLGPIEQSLEQLSQWADRLAADQQSQEAERQETAQRESAAEERRKLLERDLRLARNRVAELEQTLQDRTEELLRAQAANNALAAELQAVGDDLPDDLDDEPPEPQPLEIDDALAAEAAEANEPELAMACAEGESDLSGGVAERFARLRRTE